MAPKFDDGSFEKTVFSGKVFMYCTPGWDTLYPIVNIIRLFKSNTILSYKHGKGQQTITTYGMQYNHRTTGYQINKKDDYIEALRMVKCVFIFTDVADNYAETFINIAKSLKILLVCYSNLDGVYHFYSQTEKTMISNAEDVIFKMYHAFDEVAAVKFSEMFPDFELIEAPVEEVKISVLEECLQKLKITDNKEKKKKEKTVVKVCDMNLVRTKEKKKVTPSNDIFQKFI